jgi:hypothetical protein
MAPPGDGWGFSSYREDKQHARTMMNSRGVMDTDT